MRRALAAALTLSLTCALLAQAASAAVPRSFYGMVPFTGLTHSDFQLMGKARVGTLRFQILWPSVQASPNGPFDFSSIDPMVREAAQQRISILPFLYQDPPWVTGQCGGDLGCERHINISNASEKQQWKNFVRATVARYGRGGTFWSQNPGVPYDPVKHWQIWNEQNSPNQKNPPKLYAKLLALTDRAMSKVDRHANIVLGGMPAAPHGSNKHPQFTAWGYLSGLYRHRAAKHFGGVGLHPYAAKVDGIPPIVKKLRSVMKKHHHPRTLLYITEIGWGSSKKTYGDTGPRGQAFNVTPKRQAKNLTKSFKLLTSHRKTWKIGGVDWFTWKDPLNPPPGLCAFCYSAGLYQPDGVTAKPALRAYKHFTARTKH